MKKSRLEAFSDGVLAIIITIMVLELKVPESSDWSALLSIGHVLLNYLLSFIIVGIYWGNHHHLLHTVHHVNSKIIWSNNHLLFWLSLIPFTTQYMGEHPDATVPFALYGINLLCCAISYTLLQNTIMKHHKQPTALADALVKQKKKGYLSLILYISSIIIAFIHPILSTVPIIIVAVLWVIPDKNIEKVFDEMEDIEL